MRVWILGAGEPLPTDADFRPMRYGTLAPMMAEAGYEIVWWTSTFYHRRKVQRFSSSRSLNVDGYKLELLQAQSYPSNVCFQRIAHNRALARGFREAARHRSPPDLLIASIPTLETAETAVDYGREHNVPVVIDVKDWWPDVFLTLLPKSARTLGRLALTTEFRRARKALRNAAGITAISEATLAWALGHTERSRRWADGVFPLGFSTGTRPPRAEQERDERQMIDEFGVDPTKTLILFVGTFGAMYDLETLVEVARRMGRSGEHNVQFVLCGDGPKFDAIRKKSAELCNVVLTGRIPHTNVRTLLDMAHIGVVPTLNESFPNKLFEYCWGSLAILSADHGEIGEFVHDEKIGRTYRVKQADSMQENLEWLIRHNLDREEMGLRSERLLNERFETEIVYPKFIDHLHRIAVVGNSHACAAGNIYTEATI